MPVLVDLRLALPPQSVGVRRGTPIRVRSAGIDNGERVPALMVAWHHTRTGDRWAHLRDVELRNANGRGRLLTEMWAPEAAVQLR